MCGNGNWDNNDLENIVLAVKHSSSVRFEAFTRMKIYNDVINPGE